MHSNQLTGELQSLTVNLSTTLTVLTLGDNNISGGIPEEIQNLKNLINLDLGEIRLTGKIPDSIGNLARLQGLVLGNNKLKGSIPSSIGNITGLTILSMSGNMLEGNIPVSLSNCKTLLTLDLSDNQLTGDIPDQIFSLSSPVVLNLSRNQLSGQLPLVKDLKNLETLDLSYNKLRYLPDTYGFLMVLEFLYMQDNNFHGEIPETLGLLRGIQVMNLSMNYFSGHIPTLLSELPFIQSLDLSFNRLDGEVPNEGVFGNHSAFSIVGNGVLCGGLKSLGLPSCPHVPHVKGKQSKHKNLSKALICSITGGAFMYVVYLISIYLLVRSPTASIAEILDLQIVNASSDSESPLGNLYPKVTYGELLQATERFSQQNMIGKGKYGSVYKGTLSFSEQAVAVKVIHLQQPGAKKCFMAECEALKNVRHRNLIKAITACSGIDYQGRDFKAIVYELMPNGSLESWLHPYSTQITEEPKYLSFVQRLDIAIDIASAMHYLHNSCETPIIHRDLKPGNILLDEELSAHVADFGLARFLFASTERTKRVRSNGIPGTVGYIALEYGVGGVASTLVDVYSFGVVLLEMFTGKRPTDDMFKDDFNLRNYAKACLPDRVMTVVDPRLISERRSHTSRGRLEECLASIFEVGVICSSQSPRDRRDAADVLTKLMAIRKQYLECPVS